MGEMGGGCKGIEKDRGWKWERKIERKKERKRRTRRELFFTEGRWLIKKTRLF